MSPDSPEARLGRLETAVARLEQRTDDLSTDVRTLAPLIVEVAKIQVAMSQIQVEARSTHQAVDDLKRSIEKRREDERKDSKSFRLLLLGIGLTALLSPFGGVMVALIVGKP